MHVNSFCCTVTTKGRSHIYEEYTDPVTRVDEALLVLSSVEGVMNALRNVLPAVPVLRSSSSQRNSKSLQWFSTPLLTCSPNSARPKSPLTCPAAHSKRSAQLASGRIVRLLDGLTLSRSTPRGTPFHGSPVWSRQMPK